MNAADENIFIGKPDDVALTERHIHIVGDLFAEVGGYQTSVQLDCPVLSGNRSRGAGLVIFGAGNFSRLCHRVSPFSVERSQSVPRFEREVKRFTDFSRAERYEITNRRWLLVPSRWYRPGWLP